jgi:hypothetical protein
MSFLNPLLLLTLLAVAVPLLIHIFSRRRVPDVPFSTLRFLRRSDRRSMRRINLRRLLLLLLRMAAVALLALAFARPVVRGGLASLFPPGGSRAACILFDRSFSMRFEEDEGTLFDRARKRLAGILDNLGDDDEVAIILFDSAQEALYAAGRLEREGVAASLVTIAPSWGGTDMRAAIEEGRRVLSRSRRETRELYIISDFQRTAVRRVPARSEQGHAEEGRGGRVRAGETGAGRGRGEKGTGTGSSRDEGGRLHRTFLLPVQPEGGTNVSIEHVLTPRVALHSGEVTEVTVRIRNNSSGLGARFPLTVSIDGNRIIEKEIEIQPGGVKEEKVVFPVERVGWLEGEVRKKTDRLPADDVRFFTLHVMERVNVLLIADERGFYLETALSPEDASGDISLERRGWRQVTTADLERAEVIVLGPGAGPVMRDEELFERFVAEGGRALVLVVPELRETVTRLSRFSPRIAFMAPEEGAVSISKPGRLTRFLSPFEEDDLTALSRLKISGIPVVRGIPPEAVLLTFESGAPFMWRENKGEGTIVFAAIDPRPEAGELTLSPFFLPLVQQAVLATGPDQTQGEESLIGDPIVWNDRFENVPLCVLPDGVEFRPANIHGGRLAPAGDGAAGGGTDAVRGEDTGAYAQKDEGIIIPGVEAPGFVTIYDGVRLAGRIAVNPECRAESDLRSMSGDEAADSLGFEHYAVLGEGAELVAAIHAAREGREVSMPLFFAAVILFVIELFVAQRARSEPGA